LSITYQPPAAGPRSAAQNGLLHVVCFDGANGVLRHPWNQVLNAVDQDCDGVDG